MIYDIEYRYWICLLLLLFVSICNKRPIPIIHRADTKVKHKWSIKPTRPHLCYLYRWFGNVPVTRPYVYQRTATYENTSYIFWQWNYLYFQWKIYTFMYSYTHDKQMEIWKSQEVMDLYIWLSQSYINILWQH